MSFYADYLKERTEDRIMETDFGFATYRYLNEGKTVYIIDIFVAPDFRKLGRATELADMIVTEAKRGRCSELIGTVVPSTRGSTESIKVLIAYGMHLHQASNNLVVFRKVI